MSTKFRFALLLSCFALILAVGARQAQAQWEVKSEDGKSSIKFGLLLQPQFEWLKTADGEHVQQNFYLRRARILMGGQIMPDLTFFLETDSPNLGHSEGESKNSGSIYIQDAIMTYSFADEFKIDGGMFLPPSAYNHLQSATTLLPIDYMPFTFTENAVMQERVGRDYGVQARGYIAKHVEYRVGVFQGSRDNNAVRPLRWAARLAWNIFDQQTGYYYTGNSLGTKHYLTFGGSYDIQQSYNMYAFDAFWDQPLGFGSITAQLDWQRFNGGEDFPSLTSQRESQAEFGMYFKEVKLGPWAQYGQRKFSEATSSAGEPLPNESKWLVGLSWYPFGQKLNLKVGGGQLRRDFYAAKVDDVWVQADAPNRTVFQIQAQIFFF